ncbi:MAG: hypothetical protein MI725_03860 [Pirellulales bacterium]|nr:hypothetical protein [Pirellulales bacterium]
MSLYQDTGLPVPETIATLHEDELLTFARPGTWGTAAQRTAIVAQARKARCEAGIQESVGDEALADSEDLPPSARRVASAVALGAMDVDRGFCEQARAEGLQEGAYVEIVGLAARQSHLDVFARGLGVPARQLLEPIEDGTPAMERPAAAHNEGFFTACLPNYPEGGELARELFGTEPTGNIIRSLSLVPEEARRLITVMNQEYFTNETMFQLTYSSLEDLDRLQLELVAAKVSALNQCFY